MDAGITGKPPAWGTYIPTNGWVKNHRHSGDHERKEGGPVWLQFPFLSPRGRKGPLGNCSVCICSLRGQVGGSIQTQPCMSGGEGPQVVAAAIGSRVLRSPTLSTPPLKLLAWEQPILATIPNLNFLPPSHQAGMSFVRAPGLWNFSVPILPSGSMPS